MTPQPNGDQGTPGESGTGQGPASDPRGTWPELVRQDWFRRILTR